MAESLVTAGTWPGTSVKRNETATRFSNVKEVLIQFNALLSDLSKIVSGLSNEAVIREGAPSTGTTNTMASAAQTIMVNGVGGAITAETAKAFGALGTIPASLWGIIGVERILASTTSFTSGAANYTTGYATEALAIAALPAQTADKVRTGYITIKASASGWVAGTDGLAAGSGGNVATTTNFYTTPSIFDTTQLTSVYVANQNGVTITAQ